MSFAPRKDQRHHYVRKGDNNRALHESIRSNASRDERASEADTFGGIDGEHVADRLSLVEDSMSKLELQQDAFRPLLKLIDNVPSILKLETNMKSLYKRNHELDEKIEEAEHTTRDWKGSLQSMYHKTQTTLTEEVTNRAEDHKSLLNNLNELEANHKQLELETQMNIKAAEVRMKEEVIMLATDFEEKVDCQQQELLHEVNQCQSRLEADIEIHKDETRKAIAEMQGLEENYTRRIAKMENSINPAFDNLTSRRKVDYEDLKAWLLEEIGNRITEGIQKVKGEFEEKFKTTNLRTNQEMQTMKQDIQQIKDIIHKMKLEHFNNGDVHIEDSATGSDKKMAMKNAEGKILVEELDQFANKSFEGLVAYTKKLQDELEKQAEIIENSAQEVSEVVSRGESTAPLIREIKEDFEEHMDLVQQEFKRCQLDKNSRTEKVTLDLHKLKEEIFALESLRKQCTGVMNGQTNPEKKNHLMQIIKTEKRKTDELQDQYDRLNAKIQQTEKMINDNLEAIENKIVINNNALEFELEQAAGAGQKPDKLHASSKQVEDGDDSDPQFEEDAFEDFSDEN
eukprot:CAMPEP_0115019184 /NCGR_PEP_ID=MMETSP0216-20121206/29281_1 /TAXON_ID=223996 /ORGANISM="Protocruzia adherens, Strain Boccale" /LENGTH=568 /DNA_ID=CAMNT_0002390583 /DNA_START=34 /DNA_END=1740 /DNA_ORIENTATION=+